MWSLWNLMHSKQIYSMLPLSQYCGCVLIWLVDGEREREVPHEDEQTVTVTHSSAVLKGALSSFSNNLLMKANCLSENPARGNYLISIQVWLTQCGCSYSLLHTKYCTHPSKHKWISTCKDPIRLYPYIINRNHVSQWVIWWDLCPIFYWKLWRGLLLGAGRLSKYIIFTPFIPSRACSMPVFSTGSCL